MSAVQRVPLLDEVPLEEVEARAFVRASTPGERAAGKVWEYLRVCMLSAKHETDLEQISKRTTLLISKAILYFRVFDRINLLITFLFTDRFVLHAWIHLRLTRLTSRFYQSDRSAGHTKAPWLICWAKSKVTIPFFQMIVKSAFVCDLVLGSAEFIRIALFTFVAFLSAIRASLAILFCQLIVVSLWECKPRVTSFQIWFGGCQRKPPDKALFLFWDIKPSQGRLLHRFKFGFEGAGRSHPTSSNIRFTLSIPKCPLTQLIWRWTRADVPRSRTTARRKNGIRKFKYCARTDVGATLISLNPTSKIKFFRFWNLDHPCWSNRSNLTVILPIGLREIKKESKKL